MKYAITISTPQLDANGLCINAQTIDKFPLHDYNAANNVEIYLINPTCDFKIGETVSRAAMKAIISSTLDINYDDRFLIIKPLHATMKPNCVEIEAQVIETIRFEATGRTIDRDARMSTLNSLYPEYIVARDRKETRNVEAGDIVLLHDTNIMGQPILTFEGSKDIDGICDKAEKSTVANNSSNPDESQDEHIETLEKDNQSNSEEVSKNEQAQEWANSVCNPETRIPDLS